MKPIAVLLVIVLAAGGFCSNTCPGATVTGSSDMSELKEIITFLKVEVNRLREQQVRMGDALRQLKQTVAFSAYMTMGYHYPDEHEILPFEGELTNTGQHYNATTSIFTCPTKGLYMFQFTLYSGIIHSQIETPRTSGQLMMDGVVLAEAYGYNENLYSVEMTCSNTALIECPLSGQVWVRSEHGQSCVFGSEDKESSFSGFLIRPLA